MADKKNESQFPRSTFLERLEKMILAERARRRKSTIMQLERCWSLS